MYATPFANFRPLVLGDGRAGAADAKLPAFDVASIRRNLKPTYMQMQFTNDGFIARGVTVRQLIQLTYGIYSYDRLTGEPQWVDENYFDVTAKVDESHAASFADLSLDKQKLVLQSLLASRFALVVHSTKIEHPVYNLIVAQGGPKIHLSAPSEINQSEIKAYKGLITHSDRGSLEVQGFSMDALAAHLEGQAIVDRPVVNKTGLPGYYDFSLHWIPEDVSGAASHGIQSPRDEGSPLSIRGGSTIYGDIQKQLGLKLQPAKGMVEVLVIDRIEAPTEN
jgi:uncharacterized protein (TIGR03435 family)